MNADNLWKRIDKQESGCWLWIGARMHGSPRVWHEGVDSPAWVSVWFEVKQDEPVGVKRGMTCGQALCVHPDHVRLVAHRTVNRQEALRLHRQGKSYREIARLMGVSRMAAHKAITRALLERPRRRATL